MADEKPFEIQQVSDVELEVAASGPAPYTNRFFITISGPIVRFAFAESFPDKQPIFRTAATMHIVDALHLHQVLGAMLQKPQALKLIEALTERQGTE